MYFILINNDIVVLSKSTITYSLNLQLINICFTKSYNARTDNPYSYISFSKNLR